MAFTITINRQTFDAGSQVLIGTITLSGSYSTGGDTTVTVAGSTIGVPNSQTFCDAVTITEIPVSGTSGTGNTYLLCSPTGSGIALTNCALQVFNGTTENAATTYTSGQKAAILAFRMEFKKGI